MAIWTGAHPGNFRTGRRGYRPEAVVIHIMDGSLIGTDSWFNDPKSSVSAHYGIGRKGEVHQYVKEIDSAFHAGTVDRPEWKLIKRKGEGGGFINPNFYTIGIEHEGRGLSPHTWPQAMRQASLKLVADIVRRWNIPVDLGHIMPHCDIRRGKPDCPGKGIDLPAYIADLAGHRPGAPAAPAERSFALTLRLARTANVRPRPRVDGPPLRKLFVGDTFVAVAVAVGEVVQGNANWFRSTSNDYLWAGNTDHPSPA